MIKKLFGTSEKKAVVKEFGWEVKDFYIAGTGTVQYAQWLHPFEQPKVIDKATVNFYRRFLKKGDFAIDIGAHTGDTTVPIALCCGEEGKVLAFEPNPYVFKVLQQNSSLNPSATDIFAVNAAVTQEDGEFIFDYSDESFCNGGFFDKIELKDHGHLFRLKVRGINPEKYIQKNFGNYLSRLTLIKIDAEGYDKEIIKALSPIIRKHRPVIIAECNVNLTETERFDLFNIIASFDYSLSQIDDFDTNTIRQLAVKEHMLHTPHFDIIATPV